MPSKLPRNRLGALPFPAQPEVERHCSARSTILPEVGLVIFALRPFGLGADRGFIGLDIMACQQLLSHGPGDGPQQFTDPHHPTIQSRSESSKPVSRSSLTLWR